jgi:hypothetical protein
VREAVRGRLLLRYPSDRAAALYGYWQLMATPGGPTRLRATLGPDAYRAALAALAVAGVELPRLTEPGPAAGTEAAPGPGAPAALTTDRQLLRQALVQGVFAWGQCAGQIDLSFVRAGAAGYSRDSIVAGIIIERLLPGTYHRVEVRATPTLLDASPPVLLRFGAFTDGAGLLRVFASLPAASTSAEVSGIFGPIAGPVEAIVYRCYDGPAADDTSFVVARGTLT